jgi:transposase-like protein
MRTNRRVVGGWRQWTEDEAREALAELASTGESAASFARRRGISTQRLAYWKKRLGSGTGPKFVAVALPAATSPMWIEIAACGVVVRIREQLDVEHVARLVDAIGRRVGGGC